MFPLTRLLLIRQLKYAQLTWYKLDRFISLRLHRFSVRRYCIEDVCKYRHPIPEGKQMVLKLKRNPTLWLNSFLNKYRVNVYNLFTYSQQPIFGVVWNHELLQWHSPIARKWNNINGHQMKKKKHSQSFNEIPFGKNNLILLRAEKRRRLTDAEIRNIKN